MAQQSLQSSNITFLDTTDERQLSVYISSNHPIVQIFNANTNIYTPDWSAINLTLDASVYIDNQDITSSSQTTINWYTKNGTSETLVASGANLTITTNILSSSNPIVTYVCKVSYQGISTTRDITFSKVDAGTNGTDGSDGIGINSVTVEYGVSDSATVQPSQWQQTLPNVADGKYLWTRTITDYSSESTPDTVVLLYAKQGEKGATGTAGTSVTVSSIQYQAGTSPTMAPTSTWSNTVVSVAEGSYLWTKTTFSDGKIAYGVAKQGEKGPQGVQGPKGNDGQQLYTWLKYADTPTSGMSDIPTGKTYIGLAYNKTTATESTTYSDYTWSLIKGETGPAGPKGNDGQQYYTWVKYADDASGTNMNDLPDGKLYIGLAYNKTTSTESNVASDYTWALFKGEDGAMGAPGTDAVTFQIYSSNGYALSTNSPTVTLQTFAYVGDVEITAGATYQWYVYDESGWTEVANNSNAYLTVTREDVAFSKSYMCKMTFNGVEYTSVATIDDKNDANKVFTEKPLNYTAGDIWIVGVDYAPAGVEVGTLLKAEHTNSTYEDSDWVTSLKYDEKIAELEENMKTYNQYFSFDSTDGLKISAKDDNGTPSQFSTSLTNERLAFNYGDEAIAYINGTKMNIKEAEIESPLTVTGKYSGSTMLQAPVINIGNFSIIVESNGSLSIVANT